MDKMRQNIKNGEENLSVKKQKMRRQEIDNQGEVYMKANLSDIEQIKQHKLEYLSLFLMLLEVIITTVVLVLLITLGYVGFSGWTQNQQSNKIHLQSIQQCKDEYMTEVNKFILIKIKTAFIFLIVQFANAFTCVAFLFAFIIKILKTQRIKITDSLKSTLNLINILLSIGIILNVILLGTYLSFSVQGTTEQLPEQCQLSIVKPEIIAITVLLAIKLTIFLILLIIMFSKTILLNNKYHESHQKINPSKQLLNNNNQNTNSNPKFPQIRQFRSVLEYHFPKQQKMHEVKNGNPQFANATNDDENFKPLKTQDFLLQLQNNNQQKQNNCQLNLFMIKDQGKRSKNQVDRIIEDIDTNRRLMIYEPQQNQKCIETKKDFNKLENCRRNSMNSSHKNKHMDELSVNNSNQKDQNLLLLINSVNKGQCFDDFGLLSQNSKKKSFHQIEQKKKNQIVVNIKMERKNSSQQKRKNFPPRSEKKEYKSDRLQGSMQQSKTIKTIQNIKTKNKLIGSDKESIDEVKSIIMKLNQSAQLNHK